ncbi:hypothetical protein BTUL_0229g00140 [Botrytis tulipae]|uniref:Uncharacterized protein n=1 Tax=Botrytis tulipae TaxID=87230 RepID=A0A4Z1E7L7_9HELO|nr:hypothetical protein BTUL_0229g00140 [Botrytis tulipae]
MASPGNSEGERLAELLKETLKELRNVSSELSEQSKAFRAMTKTQCQPLPSAAEQPAETDTSKNGEPTSASTLVGQPARLDSSRRLEELGFWGDTDERFFSDDIPSDYLEFASPPIDPESFTIRNKLYYNQSTQLSLEKEPQDTSAYRTRPLIIPPSLSADERRITASSAMNSAPNNSVASSFRSRSDSSEMNNAPHTASAQSFERQNTLSTMIDAPSISNIQSLRGPTEFSADNSATSASAAQLGRESRVSASTQSSRTRLECRLEMQTWDWFKQFPYDHRLALDFDTFQRFLSTKSRFKNSRSSIRVRDWIHQQCYFDYEFLTNVFSSEGNNTSTPHTLRSHIADIYAQRKEAQLQIQRNGKASRQWRRMILVTDMSYMYKSIEDLALGIRNQDLPGFHFIDTETIRISWDLRMRGWQFQEEMAQLRYSESILKSAWSSHGLCKRSHKSDYKRWGAIFQITFYEMIPADEDRRSIWKTGAFRNDHIRNWERVLDDVENNRLVLRRSCVTIVGIIDCLHKWSPENWTMLLLTPSTTKIYIDIYGDGRQAVDREFIVAFSGIIDSSTRAVVRHWDILANHFEKLLSESDNLLEPQLHDLLLVDDSKYSKSKKYFWALNILKEIESDIAAVISQIEGFMDFSEHSPLKKQFPLPEGRISTEQETIVKKKLGVLKEDLTSIKRRFRDQRELTKDLRDGLFNASAVMESRASTRLGENVRLLTFVSIFFLPLSFTMSIWSINDNALAHINIMIGVAVVLGIITYFVVFNVDNIVFLSNQFIKKLKAGTIEHMKKNGGIVWKQRGDGLTEPALANDQNATPSSWRIPQYLWLLAWNWISAVVPHIWVSMRKLFERLAKKKVEQTEQGV